MKFKAKQIRPLGAHDEKYGTRYWGTVHDSDMSVSFNLMSPVDIPEGAELEFEERTIKETGPNSKNPGTEYMFLKKVKVLGASTPLPKDDKKLLELVYADTQRILQLLKQDTPAQSLKEQWDKTVEKDEVVEDIGDEYIDIGSIPF